MVRAHITVRGAVQGVGFRPFIYRLATSLGLTGSVVNTPRGVIIEAEGSRETIDLFLTRIETERPPRAFIQSLESAFLDPAGYTSFEIRASLTTGETTAIVMPDIATCPDCLAEVLTPGNRRYRYPFTNCTNCGPRFTIIERLPYDRPNTTMSRFVMCPECLAEYHDPANRRFHAQPNACPLCGPSVRLLDACGRLLSTGDEALLGAAGYVLAGKTVAVKGIGGFHLLAEAQNEEAVHRLRERKHREEKPFAVMVPDLASARAIARCSSIEEGLLRSPEAPIVLLHKLDPAAFGAVAPGNPFLGLMLPYSPLHHLLLRAMSGPVVATSGNRSDEPICTDEAEALGRLGGIADAFLVHDRPIYRHVDDSILRIMGGRPLVLRRARGFAPLPLTLQQQFTHTLAVGAHLKNTVAVAKGNDVFLSQHLGDLETAESLEAFRRELAGLQSLFVVTPDRVVSDIHPDYLSTKEAENLGLPHATVQHHYAHIRACMAENELEGSALGVSWDGTGLGTDGTIWGGEFLLIHPGGFSRAASLRLFPLPGGDAAAKEPRRSALGMLAAMLGEEVFDHAELAPVRAFSPEELRVLKQMITRNVQTASTSSMGRLFDAVASIIGMRQRCSFEGQAAMELEFAATTADTTSEYPFAYAEEGFRIDWEPMIRRILDDVQTHVAPARIAACFHNTLVRMIIDIARRAGETRVVLSGGCFQNVYLCERTITELRMAGFQPYWHQRVPPNDGGVALGQIIAGAERVS